MGFSVTDSVKTCVDGALQVLSAMCEKTGLIELIDCKVGKQGNRIVSSGNAIKAMMMKLIILKIIIYAKLHQTIISQGCKTLCLLHEKHEQLQSYNQAKSILHYCILLF
jgi:hypothetical protein